MNFLLGGGGPPIKNFYPTKIGKIMIGEINHFRGNIYNLGKIIIWGK